MSRITEFLDRITPEQLIERLELALEGSGLGIWDWDLRDNSVQFDRRWCEMLGLDHAATRMQLSTWESRVHPDDLARCYEDIQAHVDGRTPVYENVHRVRHADGHWVHILDRGRVSERDPEGRPVRFTGTHSDVTAAEHAKLLMAAQERQLTSMVESLPVPVVMLDARLTFVTASDVWLAERDLEKTGVLGRRYAEVFPSADKRWQEIFAQGLAGGTLSNAEEEFVAPDGSADWIRWSVRPWRLSNDEIGGIIVVQENISLERQQRAHHEQELRTAALALMAGAVGHEINTPLQVALLEAEEIIYQLKCGTPAARDLEHSAETIRGTVSRIGDIVEAMRKLSREVQPDPASVVRVRDLFASVELLCIGRARGHRIDLEFVENTPDLCVLGQTTELGQVILNLVDNAFDAVAAEAKRWVRVSAQRSPDGVEFRCVDSGPGVAHEHVQRLMQPFFTTKRIGQGTGLGLSIAHALARRMNGFLRYESGAPNTTFVVGVPAVAETAA